MSHLVQLDAIRRAFELVGVESIDENGGGLGYGYENGHKREVNQQRICGRERIWQDEAKFLKDFNPRI